MKSKIGFRSIAALVSFIAAVVVTGAGMYAEGIDGVRHAWIPLGCSLWVICLVFVIRDQHVTRVDLIEAKVDQVIHDIDATKTRMVDLHDRMGELIVLVGDYGDRRQIAGHLETMRQSSSDNTRRFSTTFAGTSSNVRSISER